VGVIADTHGHLLAPTMKSLNGVDVIIHAGDVGSAQIMEALSGIAPVYAVRGNMDQAAWADMLPITDVVALGGVMLYVLHDIVQLDLDPASAGFHAVIHGHTHRASNHRENGVLYLNPGSASQPRYGKNASIALLDIRGMELDVHFVELTG